MTAATVPALPRRWPFHDAPIDLLTGIYSFVHENAALRHRLNPAAKPFAMKYQKFSPTMLEGFTNRCLTLEELSMRRLLQRPTIALSSTSDLQRPLV